MRGHTHIHKRVARIERLLAKKLGLRRGDLALRASRARGRLPKTIKRDLVMVSQAAQLSGNPRIACQLDSAAIDDAFTRIRAHLTGDAMVNLRIKRRLGWVAALLVNLAVLSCLGVAFFVWRGGV